MKLLLRLLFCVPLISLSQIQIGQTLFGESQDDLFGLCMEISGDANTIIVGIPGLDITGELTGQVRVYELDNGIWTQIGQNIDGVGPTDFFGLSVAISNDGTIIATGAGSGNGDTPNSGYVKTYINQNGTWVQLGQTLNGDSFGDNFFRVALSADGNILAIGASGADTSTSPESGLARVYENQNGIWVQLGQDLEGDSVSDRYGSFVDLSFDGNVLAVVSRFNDDNGTDAGVVRIYEFQNGTWVQLGQDIYGAAAGDEVEIVRLSNDGYTAAIGSHGNDSNADNSGHARVFSFQNNSWIQIGQDLEGEEEGDHFSLASLSGDGSILAIGSDFGNLNGDDSGYIKIYKNQSNSWVQIGQSLLGDQAGSIFGLPSLSLDASRIAITAVGTTMNGDNAGYMKVFDLSDILSIGEQFVSDFKIFPNPAETWFTIELHDDSSLQNINIYNALGQKVIESDKSILNTTTLMSGSYFVEVITEKGRGIKKLIIR